MGMVDPKVDEAIQTLNMKDGPTRRRLLKGAGLVSASAAASALLAACSSSGNAAAAGAAGNFPKVPAWKFWFVNHVTTNLFFVPTQFGMSDAAALLGIPKPNWGGSQGSIPAEMVNYMKTAIAGNANGIATTVINASPHDTTFTAPVEQAMNQGIPVVSYNADGPILKGVPTPGTNRLCYVGQALYLSGQQMGEQIKSLAKPGLIAIFIATPGSANIQPRYDGAASVLTPAGYTVHQVATGASTSAEAPAEKAYLLGAKSTLSGAFAVDAGSTELLGPQLASVGLAGKIPAGGFDLTPGTLTAIKQGQLNFTIDQDPYLQGFLPVLYLYLFNLTGGLVLPPDTDTGLSFVTKDNVDPYMSAKTTYEGSTGATKPTLVTRSGPIRAPIATTST
ncbi:MAG: substrate-binding domain-containing protein [Actinobacteria bacterium]|nr:substrate-binding domain-containing protein [Actinomycetota bacterium]MBO0834514.1 substrate-binding domain-containing protein [Actinomycetota bacterium]